MAKKTKRTIAKFVDVQPMFVSLVSNPASKKYFTDVARQADLLDAEQHGGVVFRSDKPGVAEAIAFLRNGKPGVVQVEGVERSAHKLVMPIVRIDQEKRIVYGSAYCPPLDVQPGADVTRAELDEKVDTYGTFMDSATLETLAHAYMEVSRAVDVMHSFKAVGAVPVESTIIRDGETTEDYPHVGMWRLGVRVNDDDVWARVLSGELNSYSIAVMAAFEPIEVNVVEDVSTETASARSVDANVIEKRTCVAFQDLPLAAEDMTWDGTAADTNVRAWASDDGSGEKETIDWAAYATAFLWYDETAPEDFGSYKLGIADVVDGELKAVPAGISAAAGRLDQTDISDDDQATCQEHLGKYYAKMGKTAPWEGSADRTTDEPDASNPSTPTDEPALADDPAPEPTPEPRSTTSARGKFMDHVNEKLQKAEPMNRLWLAMYALEDFVADYLWGDCWTGEKVEYTLDDIAVAFDEAKAFCMEQLTALEGLRADGARKELAGKMLEARTVLAARVGKKIAKARLDKIEAARDHLDEVIAEATDVEESEVVEESADAKALREQTDTLKTQVAALTQRVATLEQGVAERSAAPDLGQRLDDVLAALGGMEKVQRLRQDIDDIMDDLGLAVPSVPATQGGEPAARSESADDDDSTTFKLRGVSFPRRYGPKRA